MKRLFLAAGVAALAIAAPATAERGDRGGGKKGAQAAKVERGGGKARAERSNRGSQARPARAQRAPERRTVRSDNRRGSEMRLATMRQERGRAQSRTERARPQRQERAQQQRGQGRQQAVARAQRQERAQQRGQGRQQAVARAQRQERAQQRGQGRQQAVARAQRQERVQQQQRQGRREATARVQRQERQRTFQRAERDNRVLFQRRDRGDSRVAVRDRDRDNRIRLRGGDSRRVLLSDWNDRRFVTRDGDRIRFRDGDRIRLRRNGDWDDFFERRFAARGIPAAYFGCPPGLAKKNPPCVPPGQARSLLGQRLPRTYASHILPLGLRDLYRDTDDYYWRYGDAYLYRVRRDNDLILSVLPLIGLGLGIGQPFPYTSPSYFVPSYYRPFYPDRGGDYYRYANGYIYEIDGYTGLIEDIYPAFGYGYGVGQMLPASYSYYNVPYPYRSHYLDDDDYYYRYAPGAIYRVDRDTMLITAIASLLTGQNGLAVGQPLPVGYSAYNVPFAYRDRYYDTPTNWYRYADGQIYQIDPATRLVTALIAIAALT